MLALLKCDVPLNDPCIVKGLKWLQGQSFGSTGAYGCGITLMLLEAKYTPKEAVADRKGHRKASKPKPIQLAGDDSTWAGKLVSGLLALQAKAVGGWRYGGKCATPAPNDMEGGKPGFSDVSATQYSLLGLNAAKHMSIPVKPEAFRQAADFLLAQQDKEGRSAGRIT